MEDLEKKLSGEHLQKYTPIKQDLVQPEYPIRIDENTERILVSVVSAAIVAAPIIALASKMLPEIPWYHIYKYIPF